jgi:hypothetical protein
LRVVCNVVYDASCKLMFVDILCDFDLFVLISCSWCEWYAVVGSDSVEIVPGGGSQYL